MLSKIDKQVADLIIDYINQHTQTPYQVKLVQFKDVQNRYRADAYNWTKQPNATDTLLMCEHQEDSEEAVLISANSTGMQLMEVLNDISAELLLALIVVLFTDSEQLQELR